MAILWIVYIGIIAYAAAQDVDSFSSNKDSQTVKFAANGSLPDLQLQPLPECRTQKLAAYYAEWQSNIHGSSISIEWAYGNETCDSIHTCFGLTHLRDEALVPQLVPLQVQEGVSVRFFASKKMDVNFTIQPYWVTREEFESCNLTDGRMPIIPTHTREEFEVPQLYLKPGNNYFIIGPRNPIFRCQFGLRLNVTVKPELCHETADSDPCMMQGRCLTSTWQESYECSCCHGYIGKYCEDVDACISDPCENGATCIDEPKDPTGTQFACRCPFGYFGRTCHSKVNNLCFGTPCEHNGSCLGNQTHYICNCPSGYTGSHCEVNINECASNPCVHGVCVDRMGGFMCFCIPGHGGELCDMEYNECESSPCQNDGFCIDKEDSWECHCGRGYTGRDCSLKVDLCNPSPCVNATECVDYGNTFSCTCNPGFTGLHCEININECASSPCVNGGRCYDGIAAYKCMCSHGHVGVHCEHKIEAHMPRPVDESLYPGMFTHSSGHMHNLSIIAGTLAGAILIALLVMLWCYCRFYGTSKLGQLHKQFKYKKHKNAEPSSHQIDVSSITEPRPSAAAIMEATTHGYHENALNAPLVNSLKPRRI